MRFGTAIFVTLGVTLGSSSLAMAQTTRPLSMFDLFDHQKSGTAAVDPSGMPGDAARKAAGKTVFDLFRPQRKPMARTNKGSPDSVSPSKQVAKVAPEPMQSSRPLQGSGDAETDGTNLAKEKRRLQSLAASLQNQRQAQVAQDRRLKAEAEKLNEEKERLARVKLALETLQKSLTSAPTPVAPGRLAGSVNVGSERQQIPIPQELVSEKSRRTDETRVALAEPTPSPAAKAEDTGLKSSKCLKAKAVIQGYAFTDVQARNCTGTNYLFSARRDKNSFSIKVDPQTWELTEVSKAMPEVFNRQ